VPQRLVHTPQAAEKEERLLMPSPPPSLFVIAGEPSGDLLGQDMLMALRSLVPEVVIEGIGGSLMEKAGNFNSLVPLKDLATLGAGIVARLPRLLGHLGTVRRALVAHPPDLLVTIDAPEFSFRVAKFAHTHGIPTVHCVAPSVWAWRPGRAKKIARFLNHLLTLFPFEPPLFEKEGLAATFVGHPFAHRPPGNPLLFWERFGTLSPQHPTLILLPGSRNGEIATLLPLFLKTVALLKKESPSLQVVLPTLPPLVAPLKEGLSAFPELSCTLVEDVSFHPHAFAAGTAALAASGTVTLELALAGLPHVIAYKTSPLTAALLRSLLITPWVGLPNILSRRTVVPELLQKDCSPPTLADVLLPLLQQEGVRLGQKEAFTQIRKSLHTPEPFGKAAARVVASFLPA